MAESNAAAGVGPEATMKLRKTTSPRRVSTPARLSAITTAPVLSWWNETAAGTSMNRPPAIAMSVRMFEMSGSGTFLISGLRSADWPM